MASNTATPDYYSTLGVSVDADLTAVRRAYRTLALRWHPDKNPNNKAEAEEKFKTISEAFAVLSDEDKRREYDRAKREAERPSRFRHRQHTQDFAPHPFFFTRPAFSGQRANDIFTAFFGGMDPFGSIPSILDHDPFFATMHPMGGFGAPLMSMMPMMGMMHHQHQRHANDMFGALMSGESRQRQTSFDGEGQRVTTETVTRTVNGRRSTETVQTIHRHDGSIERLTQSNGGSIERQLIGGNSDSGRQRLPAPSTGQSSIPVRVFGNVDLTDDTSDEDIDELLDSGEDDVDEVIDITQQRQHTLHQQQHQQQQQRQSVPTSEPIPQPFSHQQPAPQLSHQQLLKLLMQQRQQQWVPASQPVPPPYPSSSLHAAVDPHAHHRHPHLAHTHTLHTSVKSERSRSRERDSAVRHQQLDAEREKQRWDKLARSRSRSTTPTRQFPPSQPRPHDVVNLSNSPKQPLTSRFPPINPSPSSSRPLSFL